MKKCIDSDITQTKIVVIEGKQSNLIKDAQFLYQHANPQQCTITAEVLKQLNDVQTQSEMLGDITLPSSSVKTHLHKLTQFKDITLEVSAEDLFDYSNVIEVASMEPVNAAPAAEVQTKSVIDGPLEISEVNQIYDYQKEEVTKEKVKIQKQQTVQTDTAPPPSYANEQRGIPRPQAKTTDAQEIQPEGDAVNPPDLSFEVPELGLKGVVKDKNLMSTLIIGLVSLFCIAYYAATGSIPLLGTSKETAYEDQYQENAQNKDGIEKETVDAAEPKEEAPKPVAKRVFKPILTENEAKSQDTSLQKTLFPQEPGPDTAYLSIKSKPEGATVFINGAQLKGVTPLETFLVHANQKLEIKIKKAGYDPISKSETIPPGKRRGFMFELIPNN
ncbi:MAG: PEGA domain-containing protein [Bdellovibrionota bacterium]